MCYRGRFCVQFIHVSALFFPSMYRGFTFSFLSVESGSKTSLFRGPGVIQRFDGVRGEYLSGRVTNIKHYKGC